jgi:hypothetical protein
MPFRTSDGGPGKNRVVIDQTEVRGSGERRGREGQSLEYASMGVLENLLGGPLGRLLAGRVVR